MYSRQRRNYKVFIYTALVVALCVLFVLLFWPKSPDDVIYENAGDEKKQSEQQTTYDYNDDNVPTGEDELDDNIVSKEELETYYVVKKDGTAIKVFFSDKYGDLIELEETDIMYDLLPVEDQSRFDEGIKVNTQEELSTLLMNYES